MSVQTAPARLTPTRAGLVAAPLAIAWLVIDQVTKAVAVDTLAGSPRDLGWLRLVLVYNEGAAFGLPGFPGLFLGVTVVVLVLVGRALSRGVTTPVALAYGLVLGGALGNAVDRVIRPPGFPGGAVVDFLHLPWAPFFHVFNVADVGITVGAPLLFLLLLREDRRQAEMPGGAGPPRQDGDR